MAMSELPLKTECTSLGQNIKKMPNTKTWPRHWPETARITALLEQRHCRASASMR